MYSRKTIEPPTEVATSSVDDVSLKLRVNYGFRATL